MKSISELLFRDKVFNLLVFVCLINMAPSFDSIVTFYLQDVLKFSDMDLANFSAISRIFYILGLVLYSFYFWNLSQRKFYITTNFLLWMCNTSFLLVVLNMVEDFGISNKFFCILSNGVSSLISEMNFLPILTIWCAICPDNLEATSITLFTGLINFSYNMSNYTGSFVLWYLDV